MATEFENCAGNLLDPRLRVLHLFQYDKLEQTKVSLEENLDGSLNGNKSNDLNRYFTVVESEGRVTFIDGKSSWPFLHQIQRVNVCLLLEVMLSLLREPC